MEEASSQVSESRASCLNPRVAESEEPASDLADSSTRVSPPSHLPDQAAPPAQTATVQRNELFSNSSPKRKMAASSSSKSNSANASPQPTASQLANGTGASPYGTRSRNRTSNVRPNYAEDKESEMDFEYISSKSSQASVAAATSQPMQRVASSGSHGRRSTISSVNGKGNTASATTAKEPIPGTSTFSVNESQSRKRKAPGSSATIAHTAAAPTTAPHTATRKSSQLATPAPSTSKETALVSFQKFGAFPTNGCLKDDNKVEYKPNGTFSSSTFPCRPCVFTCCGNG